MLKIEIVCPDKSSEMENLFKLNLVWWYIIISLSVMPQKQGLLSSRSRSQ